MRILIDPVNTVISKGSPVFGSLDAVLRLRRAKCEVYYVMDASDESIVTWLRQHGYLEDKFSREFPRDMIIIKDPSMVRADFIVSTDLEKLRGHRCALFDHESNHGFITVVRAYDWQSVMNRINDENNQ